MHINNNISTYVDIYKLLIQGNLINMSPTVCECVSSEMAAISVLGSSLGIQKYLVTTSSRRRLNQDKSEKHRQLSVSKKKEGEIYLFQMNQNLFSSKEIQHGN